MLILANELFLFKEIFLLVFLMSGDRRDDALVVGVIHLVIDATGAIVFGLLQTVSPSRSDSA